MALIQVRRGSTAAWAAANPVLADGEPGFALPDGPLKVGNGVDPWLSLPEAEGGGLSEADADARYAPVSPTTGITYNPDGSVATVTENGITTTYTYNSDGTVHTDVRAGVTRTYTYDASGNLTGIAS